jgi:hypothetical protein
MAENLGFFHTDGSKKASCAKDREPCVLLPHRWANVFDFRNVWTNPLYIIVKMGSTRIHGSNHFCPKPS